MCSQLQLPGIISVSTKFLPTIMNLVKKLAEEGTSAATTNPNRNASTQSNSSEVNSSGSAHNKSQ